MWPDWVSNPGPLTYESGALPTALHGPAPMGGEALWVENWLYEVRTIHYRDVFLKPFFRGQGRRIHSLTNASHEPKYKFHDKHCNSLSVWISSCF